jgi:N-formylglutamate deformylase
MSEVRDELDPPFEIQEPANLAGPVLFNSPHSGSVYPRGFLQSSRLDLATLRRSEDSYVDDLIGGVVGRGYPLMRAHFPRCFVDVNREPYELDPRMFEGRLPSFANTRSMRVAGGLGTVARVVGDAQEIYEQRIPVDEAMRRIESLYKPYHRALRRLFTRIQRSFGAAVLVDCHSMPSSAGQKDERPRPDFVIGDRYGTSCVPLVAECVDRVLRGMGYTVSLNKPYAGGFITEHYGNPAVGLHAVQLEI